MNKKSSTIYDISEKVQLSPATISRALNHPEQVSLKTRQLILDAMEDTNYKKRKYGAPKTEIKDSMQKRTLGNHFVLNIPTSRNPFYEDIIEGAILAADQHGCHIFADYTTLTEKNLDSFLYIMNESQFCGLITMGANTASMLQRMKDTLPVVQCSEYNEAFSDMSYVCIDDSNAEKKATEYILSTGCRDIAFISSSIQYKYAYRRLHGFQEAIKEASILLPEEWIIQLPQINFSIGYDAALKLLSSNSRPHAIICVSDVYAAACIKAAHDLTIRIPDELLIVGFDNISLAISTSPSITTIDQPRFQLGYNAFELLYQEVKQKSLIRQQIILPTELIVRESTSLKR